MRAWDTAVRPVAASQLNEMSSSFHLRDTAPIYVCRMERNVSHSTMSPLLIILVYDLSATGVVRNAIELANRLSRSGRRIRLVTCCARGPLSHLLDKEVELVALGAPSKTRGVSLLLSVPKLWRYLRSAKPALVLSAGNHFHLACWLATRFLSDCRSVYRVSNSLTHARSETSFATL